MFNKFLDYLFERYRIRQMAVRWDYFIISSQPVKMSNNKMAQSRKLSTLPKLNKDDGNTLDIESNPTNHAILSKKSRATQTSMDKQEPHVSRDIIGETKAKESKILSFDVGLSEDNEVVENKKMDVHEHAIFVDGTELYESKELETILDGKSKGHSILKHTRRIGNQQYIVLEERNKGQILSTETITPMTPKEVLAFKETWRILWHPEMSEDKIPDSVFEGIQEDDRSLDLVSEGHAKGEPETYTEVEAAAPVTQELPKEKSMKEQEPKSEEKKKKKRFWRCCCWK